MISILEILKNRDFQNWVTKNRSDLWCLPNESSRAEKISLTDDTVGLTHLQPFIELAKLFQMENIWSRVVVLSSWNCH